MPFQNKGGLPLEKQIYHALITLIPKNFLPTNYQKNSSCIVKILLFIKHLHPTCQASTTWNPIQFSFTIGKFVWILRV